MKRLATLVAILSLTACGASSRWTSFVYPSAKDLTVSAKVGTFASFEECRVAAVRTHGVFGDLRDGTFECGHGCRPSETGSEVCEVTRDAAVALTETYTEMGDWLSEALSKSPIETKRALAEIGKIHAGIVAHGKDQTSK